MSAKQSESELRLAVIKSVRDNLSDYTNRGCAPSLLDNTRLIIKQLENNVNSARRWVPIRCSTYGGHPWSIIDLNTGKNVPGVPRIIEE